MADIKSVEDRSKNMAAIHSRDTKPEIILRKALWKRGYRYRKNYSKLPGKPDIVLSRYKVCVFVDSEFFHGKGFFSGYQGRKYHSLQEQLQHSNHPQFWLNKIRNNIERDRKEETELKNMGWIVIRFWSKDVTKNVQACVSVIEKTISSRNR